MKQINKVALAGAALAFALGVNVAAQSPSFAQEMNKEQTKMVGGAAMYPSKNIIENAVN